eukprot:8717974-Pyramimonas_sp.AAC.1
MEFEQWAGRRGWCCPKCLSAGHPERPCRDVLASNSIGQETPASSWPSKHCGRAWAPDRSSCR